MARSTRVSAPMNPPSGVRWGAATTPAARSASAMFDIREATIPCSGRRWSFLAGTGLGGLPLQLYHHLAVAIGHHLPGVRLVAGAGDADPQGLAVALHDELSALHLGAVDLDGGPRRDHD